MDENDLQMYLLFDSGGMIQKYDVSEFRCDNVGLPESSRYLISFRPDTVFRDLCEDIYKVQVMYKDFIIGCISCYISDGNRMTAYDALWFKDFRRFMTRLNLAYKYYQDGGQITF